MSAGDDNVFARWSRRKRAVRHNETAALEKDQLAPVPEGADASAVEEQLATTEPEAAGPAEPLPRVEDLTAESDLSAFLRKDVPKALKSAALRRMWSLDPAIRDYIGPSEYAWDFNQPGSMPGFGTLDPDDAIVGFLSKCGRGAPSDAEEAAADPETPPWRPAEAPPERQASASPDDAARLSPAEGDVEPRPEPARSPSPAPDEIEVAAGHPETAGPTQSPRSAARPRHGGAMPR